MNYNYIPSDVKENIRRVRIETAIIEAGLWWRSLTREERRRGLSVPDVNRYCVTRIIMPLPWRGEGIVQTFTVRGKHEHKFFPKKKALSALREMYLRDGKPHWRVVKCSNAIHFICEYMPY